MSVAIRSPIKGLVEHSWIDLGYHFSEAVFLERHGSAAEQRVESINCDTVFQGILEGSGPI